MIATDGQPGFHQRLIEMQARLRHCQARLKTAELSADAKLVLTSLLQDGEAEIRRLTDEGSV